MPTVGMLEEPHELRGFQVTTRNSLQQFHSSVAESSLNVVRRVNPWPLCNRCLVIARAA